MLPDDGVVDVDGGDHHECEGCELYPGPEQPLQQPPRPPHRGRLPREHLPVQVGRAKHLDQHLAGEHATTNYSLRALTLSVSMTLFLCIILRHKIIIIIKQCETVWYNAHLVHGDQAGADDGLVQAHQQEQLLLQRTGVDSKKFANANIHIFHWNAS